MDWSIKAPYPIKINRSARAKRLSMRLSKDRDSFVLTVPKRAMLFQAQRFVDDNTGWLIKAAFHLQKPQKAASESDVCFLGETLKIISAPTAKRGVYKEQGALYVSGDEKFLPRRLKEYFKDELTLYIKQRIALYGRDFTPALLYRMGGKVTRISVKDIGTRWGSCSAKGSLNFNLRLGFAPLHITDYVIAHELSHLVEMNHSDRFWQQVEKLYPDWKAARKWLKANGSKLHALTF